MEEVEIMPAGSRKQSSSGDPVLRMQLNDNKAGMENLDKEKINSIIMKHSQKSRFYKKQQERDKQLRQRAEEKLQQFKCYSQLEIEEAQRMADQYLKQCESARRLDKIMVHIDMDAFYANVEIKDNPSLADKPMAVGGESMLSTSNYIARRFGVRAGMPGFIAKDLCPSLIIVPCNFRKYQHESKKIMEVISTYDPNYMAMSLDEAYLDITEHLKQRVYLDEKKRTFPRHHSSEEVITFGTDCDECVRELRHRIYLTTQLTASAGIACNLRLAKLCSDMNKPNGQFRLEADRDRILEFISELPVRKIKGIGPSTALTLDCYDIKLCKDLHEKRAMIYLIETPNTFQFLMEVCKGLGSTQIENDYERKSLGHETTFSSKISNNIDEMLKICNELGEEVADELKSKSLEARKVSIKIKNVDFQVFSRTKTLKAYTSEPELIFEGAKSLLMNEWINSNKKLKLRLIGVRVSDLRDINSADTMVTKVSKPTGGLKTLDCFLISKEPARLIEESQLDDSENCLNVAESRFVCPSCMQYFECNQDFQYQHLDSCL